jgi:hypothetical protein
MDKFLQHFLKTSVLLKRNTDFFQQGGVTALNNQ